MKNFLKRFFVLILTCSFLISGNGLVLAIHTCLSSSTKKITLFSENSCCKTDRECNSGCNKKGDTFSSKCCSSEFTYHKLSSPFSLQKSVEFPAIDFFFSPVQNSELFVQNQPVAYRFIPPLIPVSIPFLNHQLLI